MPERGMMNGAEVILELLRTHGTDCIFASPIAVMAPLWEALAQRRARGADEKPRYFQCRHESLAVSLASGYYKATGRAQVVFLPTGLGVLHGAMALRTALQERVPMTVISPDTLTYGEVPELDPGPEWPSVLIDQHGPARSAETCVKWAKEAKTPADLVHEAFLRIAKSRIPVRFQDDGHLVAVATLVMRHILVDQARSQTHPDRSRCVPLDLEFPTAAAAADHAPLLRSSRVGSGHEIFGLGIGDPQKPRVRRGRPRRPTRPFSVVGGSHVWRLAHGAIVKRIVPLSPFHDTR